MSWSLKRTLLTLHSHPEKGRQIVHTLAKKAEVDALALQDALRDRHVLRRPWRRGRNWMSEPVGSEEELLALEKVKEQSEEDLELEELVKKWSRKHPQFTLKERDELVPSNKLE
eukprot:NODE_9433_length_642_cov_118.475915_g9167_i0.p2 GENE.NODE_9433_length_642_cov_118.475915_g9167_i0~~NODE_9433_length_642_cov_118.475915_g9167_i0.p2  ORF type:complete len:114 (+),score=24.94 NODE_9433_length_642_cov_118.475915_g9167_i0:145-486(+)